MLTAVTGINWGDEGKGRVIDLLAENADVVEHGAFFYELPVQFQFWVRRDNPQRPLRYGLTMDKENALQRLILLVIFIDNGLIVQVVAFSRITRRRDALCRLSRPPCLLSCLAWR